VSAGKISGGFSLNVWPAKVHCKEKMEFFCRTRRRGAAVRAQKTAAAALSRGGRRRKRR
jgi:hypothetical protein